jgi:hypothetical protein
VYRFYQLIKNFLSYKRLKAQGVVFPNGYHLWADLVALTKILDEEKNHINWGGMIRKSLKVDIIPPVTGVIMEAAPFVSISSAHYLQDLYIN